jgi:RimJ/RimL family protein N-acetyltransferase
VRSLEAARDFIEQRYRESYRANGFGLYLVELKTESAGTSIGICGFVKRDELPQPDIGFAFLPQFEKQGYAFESARAVMNYGRDALDLSRVLAITTKDNESSIKLLGKLGFDFERTIRLPNDENGLRLFACEIAGNATVLSSPTSSD